MRSGGPCLLWGGSQPPPQPLTGGVGGMPEPPEKQTGTDSNGDSLVCAHGCRHRALPSVSPPQVWDMQLAAGQAGPALDRFADPQSPVCPFRWLFIPFFLTVFLLRLTVAQAPSMVWFYFNVK